MLVKVPVLMYHALYDEREVDGDAVHYIHVSVSAFREQMQWLFNEGYTPVNASRLLDKNLLAQVKKPILITFDDGYLSLLQMATPVLKHFNFSATLFLTTSAVGAADFVSAGCSSIRAPENDRPLTWAELSLMKEAGWAIEAHGARHLQHNQLTEEELREEMGKSAQAIASHLNDMPVFYAFPFGKYNSLCFKLLKELGFEAAFSVHQDLVGNRSDVRRLPRIEINRFDGLKSFSAKVEKGFKSSVEAFKHRLIYQMVYRNIYLKDFLKLVSDKVRRGDA